MSSSNFEENIVPLVLPYLSIIDIKNLFQSSKSLKSNVLRRVIASESPYIRLVKRKFLTLDASFTLITPNQLSEFANLQSLNLTGCVNINEGNMPGFPLLKTLKFSFKLSEPFHSPVSITTTRDNKKFIARDCNFYRYSDEPLDKFTISELFSVPIFHNTTDEVSESWIELCLKSRSRPLLEKLGKQLRGSPNYLSYFQLFLNKALVSGWNEAVWLLLSFDLIKDKLVIHEKHWITFLWGNPLDSDTLLILTKLSVLRFSDVRIWKMRNGDGQTILHLLARCEDLKDDPNYKTVVSRAIAFYPASILHTCKPNMTIFDVALRNSNRPFLAFLKNEQGFPLKFDQHELLILVARKKLHLFIDLLSEFDLTQHEFSPLNNIPDVHIPFVKFRLSHLSILDLGTLQCLFPKLSYIGKNLLCQFMHNNEVVSGNCLDFCFSTSGLFYQAQYLSHYGMKISSNTLSLLSFDNPDFTHYVSAIPIDAMLSNIPFLIKLMKEKKEDSFVRSKLNEIIKRHHNVRLFVDNEDTTLLHIACEVNDLLTMHAIQLNDPKSVWHRNFRGELPIHILAKYQTLDDDNSSSNMVDESVEDEMMKNTYYLQTFLTGTYELVPENSLLISIHRLTPLNIACIREILGGKRRLTSFTKLLYNNTPKKGGYLNDFGSLVEIAYMFKNDVKSLVFGLPFNKFLDLVIKYAELGVKLTGKCQITLLDVIESFTEKENVLVVELLQRIPKLGGLKGVDEFEKRLESAITIEKICQIVEEFPEELIRTRTSKGYTPLVVFLRKLNHISLTESVTFPDTLLEGLILRLSSLMLVKQYLSVSFKSPFSVLLEFQNDSPLIKQTIELFKKKGWNFVHPCRPFILLKNAFNPTSTVNPDIPYLVRVLERFESEANPKLDLTIAINGRNLIDVIEEREKEIPANNVILKMGAFRMRMWLVEKGQSKTMYMNQKGK